MAKKIVSDGWHDIAGYRVYVEDGKVMRGIKRDYNGGIVSASVYRGSWRGGWDNENGYNSVAAFRAGVKRGTITLM